MDSATGACKALISESVHCFIVSLTVAFKRMCTSLYRVITATLKNRHAFTTVEQFVRPFNRLIFSLTTCEDILNVIKIKLSQKIHMSIINNVS